MPITGLQKVIVPKKGTITFMDELHADHWTSKSYSSKKKGTITFLDELHADH